MRTVGENTCIKKKRGRASKGGWRSVEKAFFLIGGETEEWTGEAEMAGAATASGQSIMGREYRARMNGAR